MNSGPAPNQPQVSPGNVRGRTIACGPDTFRRLSRLLGLDRDPPQYKVDRATWVRDRLEVGIVGVEDSGALVLVLEETRPDGAYIAGQQVCLWLRDSHVPEQLARSLQSVTQRLLQRLPLSDLERMVAIDPAATELKQEEPAAGQQPSQLDGISIPTTAVFSHTAQELYADFFAASEIRRAGCDIIDVHSAHTLVSHGDVECSYCAVCVPSPRAALVRLPVYETVRNIGRPVSQHGAFDESEDPSTAFCSDMTEQDVIKGSPARLERVLRHAELHRTREKLLVVGLCLPDVIGEDQEGAVRRYANTTTTPVFSVPAAPRSWAWLAKDLLRTRRLSLPRVDSPDLRAINLIGFSRNAGTSELVSLLAEAGVSVRTLLLPELDMAAVARIPEAALNVYLHNIHWEKTYEHLMDDPGRRHLVIDGPYGLQGTRIWLQQVCQALGLDRDIDRLFNKHWQDNVSRWNALQAQASACRLGLVVPECEVETLTESRYTWGIPLTQVLREMGFGLDLFIGSESAARRFRSNTKLGQQDYTITVFESLPSLIEALQDSPCQAVFSSYMFDWRLVRAGKAPFSTLEFECGLAGALSTLERLVAVCRIPLFRAGRRFMAAGLPKGGTDDR